MLDVYVICASTYTPLLAHVHTPDSAGTETLCETSLEKKKDSEKNGLVDTIFRLCFPGRVKASCFFY